MTKDDLPDKCGDLFCQAWGDLIFSRDRGKVYDFFDRERKGLIKHLQQCEFCANFLAQIKPTPKAMERMEHLGSLDPLDFAALIRELYANAKDVCFVEGNPTD